MHEKIILFEWLSFTYIRFETKRYQKPQNAVNGCPLEKLHMWISGNTILSNNWIKNCRIKSQNYAEKNCRKKFQNYADKIKKSYYPE